MRAMMVTVALVMALGGCSSTSPEANSAELSNAVANYKPPTVMSRLDSGSRAERRFQRMDNNQDGYLTADELPEDRGDRLLKRYDTNTDGRIDADEWGKGILARFDKLDANHDGTVTSEEREDARGARKGGRRAAKDRAAEDGAAGDVATDNEL